MSSLVILLLPPFLLLDPVPLLLSFLSLLFLLFIEDPEPSTDERLVVDCEWLILPVLSVKSHMNICYLYSLSWVKSNMHSHCLTYSNVEMVKSKCGLAGAIATDSPVNPRLLWQLLDLQLYMKLKGQVAALVSYHMNGSIPFNGITQQTAETMPLAFYRWKSIKRTCENLEEFPPLLREIQKVTDYLSYLLTYLLAYLLTNRHDDITVMSQ